jgi:hypothetical protein
MTIWLCSLVALTLRFAHTARTLIRLIVLMVYPPRCYGQAVTSRGPMGWLTNRLPASSGLASERGANPSGLLVAWLIRGASAIVPEIRRARYVPTSPMN